MFFTMHKHLHLDPGHNSHGIFGDFNATFRSTCCFILQHLWGMGSGLISHTRVPITSRHVSIPSIGCFMFSWITANIGMVTRRETTETTTSLGSRNFWRFQFGMSGMRFLQAAWMKSLKPSSWTPSGAPKRASTDWPAMAGTEANMASYYAALRSIALHICTMYSNYISI